MKLGATFFISIIALLLASVVVEGCLTLKGSGKTQVKGGNSSYYKLRIATNRANVTNATLTVCVVLPPTTQDNNMSNSPLSSSPRTCLSRLPSQKASSMILSPAFPPAAPLLNPTMVPN